jgi:hypothetical protein
MAKQLFQSKAASIKKKMTFMISSEMAMRLEKIERRAEKAGVSFPLNEHVEDAILRLIKLAESQLDDINEPVVKPSGFNSNTTANNPTASSGAQ